MCVFTCDYLRLDTLTLHRGNCVGVPCQCVNVCFGPNVPNLQHTPMSSRLISRQTKMLLICKKLVSKLERGKEKAIERENESQRQRSREIRREIEGQRDSHSGCSITAARHQNVDGWMEVQVVNSAQVTVVVTNNL